MNKTFRLLPALLILAFSQSGSAATFDSSLTLFVYPPSNKLNWQSPKTLLKSFLAGTLLDDLTSDSFVKYESDFHEAGTGSSRNRSTMGHTIAHIQCRLPGGAFYDRWSSFSGQDSSKVDHRNIYDRQLGMGMLFEKYVDGHIIAGEENAKLLTYYRGGKKDFKPKFMEFEITPESCQNLKKMVTFFESFHFSDDTDITELEERAAKDPESVLYFTNVIDPYTSYLQRTKTGRGEVGGGCAPYGAALVKMSGRYDSLFEKSWRRLQPISERLMGETVAAPTDQPRRVSIFSLLFGDLGNSWVYQGTPTRVATMYDPQLIWDFVGSVEACLDKPESCPAGVNEWLHSNPYTLHGIPVVLKDSYVRITTTPRDVRIKQTIKVRTEINGIAIPL